MGLGRRKPLLLALALAAASATLSACGDDESTAEGGGGGAEGAEIAVVLAGKQIPYYLDLAAGMESEAEARGMTVDIDYANQDVATQIDQVQNAITQQPDGLVVGPIDQEALIPAYRQAAEANIPIATVSDNIGEDGRQYQLAFMGEEYTETGAKRAEWLVEELNGRGTVAPIHAIRGGNYTEANWEGAQEVFASEPGITVYEGPYVGDFTPQVGLEGAQNVLTQHPDLDALFVDNDDLAYGAIQAVREREIPQDEILILGNDGGEPAIDALRKGELDYTLSVCGYDQGRAAIDTLYQYLEDGTEPPEYVKTLQLEFTSENVDEVLESREGEPQCTQAY